MKYVVQFEFYDEDDLNEFIKNHNVFVQWLKRKNEKSPTDKRGLQTSSYHILAKKIREEEPDLTYKEALKKAGEQIRKSKQIVIV